MTRTEFYIKVSVIFIISATFVCFADTKESMIHHVNWLFATVSSFFIWCDFAVMPDFCHRFLVKILSNGEANHPGNRPAATDIEHAGEIVGGSDSP